jgi:hypothetical protein
MHGPDQYQNGSEPFKVPFWRTIFDQEFVIQSIVDASYEGKGVEHDLPSFRGYPMIPETPYDSARPQNGQSHSSLP